MNILIFGTGNAAVFYIKDNKEFFENNIEIIAFIDNNEKKYKQKFIEKKVIAPNDIFKYTYDMILICSVYEEEIYEQLICEVGIEPKKIYTRKNFFEQIIFCWYDRKYDLYNKKILIIGEDFGADIKYRKYYERYKELFCIVGIISLNKINIIQNYQYDYILFTNLNSLLFQNYRDVKNDNLLNKEISDTNILLPMEVIQIYFNNIKEFQYGEKYDKKKFLVIRINMYPIGLGSIAMRVARGIAYAKKKDYIPVVDMKTIETQYLEEGEYGKINAYNKFFEQPSEYDMDDIKDAKHVLVMYSRKYCSKKEENEMVLPKIKKELYSKYCEFKKKFNNKRVLGVLFRGTDYANLKPYAHNIQPDLDSMVEMVKQKMLEWENFDLIYLCTEVQEACERFEDEFGKEKICYYPQLRYKSHTKKYLAEVNNDAKERVSQGKDYLVALNCLASCHSLIAGQCFGTEVALMINNNQYKNKYLFKLGKYGIDDI